MGQVTEGDVQFVMEQCDKTNDGKMTREELLMALSQWKDLVATNQANQKSTACVLL